MPSAESDRGGPATAGLVQAVLDAEAERRAEQAEAAQEVLFADDLLPGVGEPAITLREGVVRGGVFTLRDARVAPGFRRARERDPVGAGAEHTRRVPCQ